ncbi:protein NCBP2AS2 homolog [Parasteatoda tepidariorum]|uniref:protein NCBP2AS2 homolog n=1 Tax=Parasteatoda tepidariorum TaxID=114398 RepID=UPI00077FBAAB|nr:protein NCBP2AS2 homolog [Parasteatoda tepidariorum]
MVLRFLIRYLANNEKLIQSLADSYPIRQAARVTARFMMRAKFYQEKTLENIKKNSAESLSKSEGFDFSSFLSHQIEKLKKILDGRNKR